MSFVVKKRDLSDPAQLQALIVQHADDLERGLTILDSRFLGQVTIDVVGLDADGALVLIAVGLVANEDMLLKAVDAYSWCLEYPDAIRRLYPAVQCSSAQPPRVMFVVERMPDAFHRKIKQLGFSEVDCVEFRHLDVDGTAAVYFDTLARLRRGAGPTKPTSAATAPTAPTEPPAPTERPAPPPPASNGRPTSVKLQKLLGADRPAGTRERASVVRMVPRSNPQSDSRPVSAAPQDRPAAPKASIDQLLGVTASAVAERCTDVPEALVHGPDAVALVECFATTERKARNGHVEADITIPRPESAPLREQDIRDVVAAELVAAPMDPFIPQPGFEEPSPAAARLLERELAAPTLSTPDPEPATSVTLELESHPTLESELVLETRPVVEAAELNVELEVPPPVDTHHDTEPTPQLELEARSLAEAEPELKLELESHPVVEAEPKLELELESHARVQTEPALKLDPEPVNAGQLTSVAEPQPTMGAIKTEPAETAPARTPSVFSRRAPEAVAARDAKVSFAGMAKDLLPQNHRAPVVEAPVSAPRASVEDITRGALDELVGSADKRTSDDRPTAFARPGNAFAKAAPPKQPRTIAPPPSDGQPIAGAPNPGSTSKRIEATEPPAKPAGGETAQATPQGFEGLPFPNDGVLTRQWMEFLNQMAAGK